jgi:hypothetical protein
MTTLKVVLNRPVSAVGTLPTMRTLLEHVATALRLGFFSSGGEWDAESVLSTHVSDKETSVELAATLVSPRGVTLELLQGILTCPADFSHLIPVPVIELDNERYEPNASPSRPPVQRRTNGVVSSPRYLDPTQPIHIWVDMNRPLQPVQHELLTSGFEVFESVVGDGPFHGRFPGELSAIGATQLSRVADANFLYWADAIAAPAVWIDLLANFFLHNSRVLRLFQVRIEQDRPGGGESDD